MALLRVLATYLGPQKHDMLSSNKRSGLGLLTGHECNDVKAREMLEFGKRGGVIEKLHNMQLRTIAEEPL